MVDRELTAATSSTLILALLSEGDSYGYAIIQRVKALTGGEMRWSESMLYPVLHRLEKAGLIKGYWRTSESGRKRKYYALRAAGARRLADKKRQWQLANDALGQLWGTAGEP